MGLEISSVKNLTSDDVANIVSSFGVAFRDYAYDIKYNGIDGNLITDPHLSDDDFDELFEGLGIKKIHQIVIKNKLKEIRYALTTSKSDIIKALDAVPLVNNSISSSSPPSGVIVKKSTKTLAFFTHDWGINEDGSNNHDIVFNIYKNMRKRGIDIWFDEAAIAGSIQKRMADGIENTECIVVFITQRYLEKVAIGDTRDNCSFEFQHAFGLYGSTKMIPVVMESRMRDNSNWKGIAGAALKGLLYIDMVEHKKPVVFDMKCNELFNMMMSVSGINQDNAMIPDSTTKQVLHHQSNNETNDNLIINNNTKNDMIDLVTNDNDIDIHNKSVASDMVVITNNENQIIHSESPTTNMLLNDDLHPSILKEETTSEISSIISEKNISNDPDRFTKIFSSNPILPDLMKSASHQVSEKAFFQPKRLEAISRKKPINNTFSPINVNKQQQQVTRGSGETIRSTSANRSSVFTTPKRQQQSPSQDLINNTSKQISRSSSSSTGIQNKTPLSTSNTINTVNEKDIRHIPSFTPSATSTKLKGQPVGSTFSPIAKKVIANAFSPIPKQNIITNIKPLPAPLSIDKKELLVTLEQTTNSRTLSAPTNHHINTSLATKNPINVTYSSTITPGVVKTYVETLENKVNLINNPIRNDMNNIITSIPSTTNISDVTNKINSSNTTNLIDMSMLRDTSTSFASISEKDDTVIDRNMAIIEDSSITIPQFVRGNYDGEGTYTGDMINGEANGYGISKKITGSSMKGRIYEGEFKDNKRHGKGICTWSDGDIYKGEYIDDKKNGSGIYIYGNGEQYNGQWRNDEMHGKGIYTWYNGDIYNGEYQYDKRNGKGILTYKNGNIYQGDWKDGKMHGIGIYTWKNGDQYEGEWKYDDRNGKGLFIYSNGDKYNGEFIDDDRNGKGIMIYTDKNEKYEGLWKDDCRNGKGIHIYYNGDRYEGEWLFDKRNGKGIYTCSNGDRYVGEFKDDKYNGKGILKLSDGTTFIGTFKDNELQD